ncbi:CGNR zinc finger domain-containing protein [Agreia bicolorata]|uniref:CGNR zinc finger domain-containing protein n=1 Tax=Agreia bicolorata TaxID=110935 RepID=A0A1T4YLS1_9MICO|nr:CGNR zinc finger domain-containing protein [Agreia bicolorata]SKB02633.1 CGNR zinc finger domain-containing protein [Agreia bicolorata]
MDRDEELLLAVLNSAPVIDGRPVDGLDGEAGRQLALGWGGTGAEEELAQLRRARNAIQSVIRTHEPSAVDELAGVIEGVMRAPRVTRDGVVWDLHSPEGNGLPVDTVLAWSSVSTRFPGRLRACANDECNLFLVDHSRPGTAKWCSMATCGNRMKARTHASRSRG